MGKPEAAMRALLVVVCVLCAAWVLGAKEDEAAGLPNELLKMKGCPEGFKDTTPAQYRKSYAIEGCGELRVRFKECVCDTVLCTYDGKKGMGVVSDFHAF